MLSVKMQVLCHDGSFHRKSGENTCSEWANNTTFRGWRWARWACDWNTRGAVPPYELCRGKRILIFHIIPPLFLRIWENFSEYIIICLLASKLHVAQCIIFQEMDIRPGEFSTPAIQFTRRVSEQFGEFRSIMFRDNPKFLQPIKRGSSFCDEYWR